MISSHFMFFVVWKVMCQIFRFKLWKPEETGRKMVELYQQKWIVTPNEGGSIRSIALKIGEILVKIWGPTKDCGCLFPHVRPNKLRSVGSWGTPIIKRQHPSDFWMGAQLRFCFDPLCTWFPASSNSGSPGTRYLATRFCTVTCPADLGPPRSG